MVSGFQVYNLMAVSPKEDSKRECRFPSYTCDHASHAENKWDLRYLKCSDTYAE